MPPREARCPPSEGAPRHAPEDHLPVPTPERPLASSSSSSPPRDLSAPGGGLRIFGCLWRIADDDLVFPSWLEFALRCLGLAIVIGILVFERVTESSCASEFHLDTYLWVAVFLFAAAALDQLFLALESAKGSIWDRDRRVRRRVVPLVYVNIFLTVLEGLWALVGSVWVVRGLMAECVKDGVTYADAPLYAISGVVLATWVFLFLKVIVCLVSFNTMECYRMGKKAQGQNETLIADSRPSLKSRLASLFVKKSTIGMFSDVGVVLSEIFDDDSFVPTDLAAALILLYARRTDNQSEGGSDDVEQTETAGAGDANGGGTRDMRRGQDQSLPDRIHAGSAWDDKETVAHYMAYAGAAYGYTWFLMRNTRLNLFKMYPHLRCSCCCCLCPADEGLVVEADNCCSCNTAALRAMLPHLDGDSLVHVSFRNKMAEVPFFVAVDHGRRKIVVSIRGTLSLEDTLTDLCAKPETMGGYHEQLSGYVVHSGMFRAARYVYDELHNKNILNKALSYFDDYGLVVTGHSLGAGTAVILAFMLRQTHHSTKCYAFSPPGGLLNEAAARESENFTLSVVVGKDLVARLSLHAIARLKDEMKDTLNRCRLPKYQILSSGISACCVKDWKSSLAEEEDEEEAGTSFARSCSQVSTSSHEPFLRSSPNAQSSPTTPLVSNAPPPPPPMTRRSTLSDHERLFLPGRIWHVEGAVTRRKKDLPSAAIRTAKDFQDILVSPKMLTDHFPNNVYDTLQAIAKKP